ncbi:hypothetical protein [Verrucomicrobium sp. BvORR034]|uniref:hypothetical protein n=1 Tax=Verrucomicrobium sp. BvORR034 TaxID=1396418 RepID=UPI000678F931|nr:hypothetical protein [Verrucomicrobium sp. BvORR034]
MIIAQRSHERLSHTSGTRQTRLQKMGSNVLPVNSCWAKTMAVMMHKQEIAVFIVFMTGLSCGEHGYTASQSVGASALLDLVDLVVAVCLRGMKGHLAENQNWNNSLQSRSD